MPTPIDYQPKHKRVLRDGQIPRGPKRWARAFGNLFEHPTSKGARLLQDRIATACEFRDFGDRESFEHLDAVNFGRYDEHEVRKYWTCNIFCAAMVIQLDIASTDYADVLSVFEGDYVRTWYNSTTDADVPSSWQPYVRVGVPTRTAHCQFCGNKVPK